MQEADLTYNNGQRGQVSCPNCRNAIRYFDTGRSSYFGCDNCGSFFEHNPTQADRVLRSFEDKNKYPPSLPIGTRGKGRFTDLVLVGYMLKKEADDEVYWSEYTFSKPGDNYYVILAEYNGHWMMITRSEQQHFANAEYNPERFVYDSNMGYELYLSYKLNIAYAVGEFDWNILDDEQLETYEYVNAPQLLIKEMLGHKEDWYRGIYVSPAQLLDDFEIDPELLPARDEGIRFNPATFYPKFAPMMVFTGILLALLVCWCAIDSFLKPEKNICSASFVTEADSTNPGNARALVTSSFEIKGPTALSIKVKASVDNSWAELPMALVRDEDGKAFEIDKTVSYYSGYDDGESWSEGSREEEGILTRIPGGTYHLNIFPYTENNQPTSFSVDIYQNIFLTSNFIFFLLALVTYPIIQWVRKYNFENSKWFKSEYGSYNAQT